jgi:hypothetical protein
MNSTEAKFLLQSYRPDGSDALDPQFAEALEQAKRDPDLERWFREQQAIARGISQDLRSLPVPATLRDEILAGHKTLRPERRRARSPVFTVLAACFVAVLCVIAILMSFPRTDDFAGYRAEMVQFVTDVEQGREPLQLTAGNLSDIQKWMTENSVHKDIQLPKSLAEGAGVGCRVVNWNGKSVTLACFHLKGGQVAHLLVIDRQAIPNAPIPGTQTVASLDGMSTGAWSNDTHTLLLVSSVPTEALQRLL